MPLIAAAPAAPAHPLDLFRLDGRVAVVTGASSGLGVAFALGLAQAGADIAICARRPELLERTRAAVEALGRRCVAIHADVTEPADCEAVATGTVAALGRLDVLINNAGVATAVPALRESPEDFARVVDINLNGTFFMATACARVMSERGGSIVNVGSVLGSTTAGLPQAAYSASKAAIIGLTRDLAQQWTSRRGIRVNALAPGFFTSEMTDQMPDGLIDDLMLARSPFRRRGEPHELVAAALFLASDASSYMTGVLLPVDGGLLTS